MYWRCWRRKDIDDCNLYYGLGFESRMIFFLFSFSFDYFTSVSTSLTSNLRVDPCGWGGVRAEDRRSSSVRKSSFWILWIILSLTWVAFCSLLMVCGHWCSWRLKCISLEVGKHISKNCSCLRILRLSGRHVCCGRLYETEKWISNKKKYSFSRRLLTHIDFLRHKKNHNLINALVYICRPNQTSKALLTFHLFIISINIWLNQTNIKYITHKIIVSLPLNIKRQKEKNKNFVI